MWRTLGDFGLPLLDFGCEREGIDVSKLVLTHHNLKGQGRRAMTRRPS
jgi:type I restriction enzyme R subunit